MPGRSKIPGRVLELFLANYNKVLNKASGKLAGKLGNKLNRRTNLIEAEV